jgi:hypothetical protein
MGVGMGFSLMGMSTSVLFAPIIVSLFGSRYGNGIMFLPFFVADVYVSWKYRHSFNKTTVLKLIPFSVLGMIIAGICAKYISEELFKWFIAGVIIFSSILFFMKKYEKHLTKLGWFFGLFGGASSYLCNISGPIFNVYLLSYEDTESNFLGTRSIFFTVLNFCKFFLYLFVYKNINSYTMSRGAISIPFIFVGVYLAKKLLDKIGAHTFNQIIVILSILAAIALVS